MTQSVVFGQENGEERIFTQGSKSKRRQTGYAAFYVLLLLPRVASRIDSVQHSVH